MNPSEEAEAERAAIAQIEEGLAADPYGVTLEAAHGGDWKHVPGVLWKLWRAGRIPADSLPDCVAWTWIHNRTPTKCLGERRWVQLFKAAGFNVAREGRALDEDGRITGSVYPHLTELPTEPITVYRGASLESGGRGLAWSLYAECAENFASRWADIYQKPGGLYRATIPPRAIFGLFGDEQEQEVVVNPNMLRGRVELVKQVEPDREKFEAGLRRFKDLTHRDREGGI